MEEPHLTITSAKIILNGTLALAGGVVREITHGKGTSVVRFLAGGVVGAFTGTLAFCICGHFGFGDYITAALTGMAGYTGAPLLDAGSAILRKFVKKESDKL